MQIDLEDVKMKIVMTHNERMRLTLEYPCTVAYRERVMQALAGLIMPQGPSSSTEIVRENPYLAAAGCQENIPCDMPSGT